MIVYADVARTCSERSRRGIRPRKVASTFYEAINKAAPLMNVVSEIAIFRQLRMALLWQA